MSELPGECRGLKDLRMLNRWLTGKGCHTSCFWQMGHLLILSRILHFNGIIVASRGLNSETGGFGGLCGIETIMQDEGIWCNVKFWGQLLVWIFWSCLQPGSVLEVQKGIFLTEKTHSVTGVPGLRRNTKYMHWVYYGACYISYSFGSTLHSGSKVLKASTGQCRDFALDPWTDFRIISDQISPKAKFFGASSIEKIVTLKTDHHFQMNRQCILYLKCWNHRLAFLYFLLYFQPKPLAERKSTRTALNPTLFVTEFTIQQINKATQL